MYSFFRCASISRQTISDRPTFIQPMCSLPACFFLFCFIHLSRVSHCFSTFFFSISLLQEQNRSLVHLSNETGRRRKKSMHRYLTTFQVSEAWSIKNLQFSAVSFFFHRFHYYSSIFIESNMSNSKASKNFDARGMSWCGVSLCALTFNLEIQS